jgi:transcriptional regulator with XRE-family HTH domain
VSVRGVRDVESYVKDKDKAPVDNREDVSPAKIVGARLRQLRHMRGLSLQEVSAKAGISHSFLSMLERGRVDVAISRLKSIADVYGIRLSELLINGEDEYLRPRVIPLAEMAKIDRGPGTVYRLVPNAAAAGLEFVHSSLDPHRSFDDVLAHKGHDCCWVLRGVLTVLYGGEEFRVPQDTAVIFSGRTAHTFRNDSDEIVEFVAMTTVPYW